MASFAITRRDETFEVLVDDADLEQVLAAGPWFVQQNQWATYAARNAGRRTTVALHRFLTGAPRGFQVDHLNCNGLDNRRANLRVCSQSQNQGNSRRRTDNTSGFKGVSWNKQAGKWQARIRRGGRRVHLGYFTTPEDAHTAYCLAAVEVFGEFARSA